MPLVASAPAGGARRNLSSAVDSSCFAALQHPVNTLRCFVVFVLLVASFLPAYSTDRLVTKSSRCAGLATGVELVWQPVKQFCFAFLALDLFGFVLCGRRTSSTGTIAASSATSSTSGAAARVAAGCSSTHTRWWGRREKLVVRLTMLFFWLYALYGCYVYGAGIAESRFKCWNGPIVLTILAIWVFLMWVPVWWAFFEQDRISATNSASSRYVIQEDLEDELQDLEENPVSYQVWRSGKMLYASLTKSEVRKWLVANQADRWTDCVVREVQL
ncbi:unnamed protein product [Amoebophrya sp. A120]|nr:unnamed protein product [Amoebophrya sp. A120]|eukprot:GSA120T00019466001.1